jgi:cell wall assembly regulator SMI1
MKTISDSFKIIIDKQKQLDYYMLKILRDPVSNSDIEKLENELELKLNKELIELYSLADGIENDYKTASGLLGLIPIYEFMSLSNVIDYYKSSIDFEDSFLNWDTSFKPDKKLFPFLHDGAGNCYWVDLNENTDNYNRIFWTNTFGENPDYMFDSLKIMFHVIAESYIKGIFWIDDEGYLDCDYDAFDKLADSFKN